MKDTWQKYRYIFLIIFVFCMTATMSFFSTHNMSTSSAVSTSGFNPGNIISDAVMSNYNSMSVADIQNFLTSKNSCNNTNEAYWRQLENQYPNLDWHFENGHFVCLSEERFGDTWTEIGTGQTAAEIIYQAAQDYRINPQVLLVLLEKEQSLISDTFPNNNQYRSATGYGCPDTAACNSKYYGFKNQIRNAAALFRNVLDYGYSVYPEKTHGVYISYSPNSACGRSEVYIENRATAALYRYTPYQPNAAALNAGYGIGDGCSAYGNRNFYLYFNSWFGDSQATGPFAPDKEDEPNTDPSDDNNESPTDKPDQKPDNGSNQPDPIPTIPDGTYIIRSAANSSKALDVSGGTDRDGANIQLWSTNNTISQSWSITYNATTDDYTIRNVISGRALDVSNGFINASTNIQLYSHNSTCSQRWKLISTASGSYAIVSACNNNYAIDIADGRIQDGANIQLWTKNDTIAQEWKLEEESTPTIPDGTYIIRSAANSSKALDVSGGTDRDGANIQLWSTNNTISQSWSITYNATTDDYTIRNVISGRALDVSNGFINASTNIQLYSHNSTCSQRWKLISTASGSYAIVSACNNNYAIDIADGRIQDGANIQLWTKNDTIAQEWKLD